MAKVTRDLKSSEAMDKLIMAVSLLRASLAPLRQQRTGSFRSRMDLSAAAGGAEAAEVDGNGEAYEEAAKGIEPIVIEGYGIAEDPRHEAEHKR
jgi:hypothetical protein